MDIRKMLALSAASAILAALEACGGPQGAKASQSTDPVVDGGGSGGHEHACGAHDGGACGAKSK